MEPQQLALPFPVRGLAKRFSFAAQGEEYTVDCDNVWPTQWSSGRERGGVRPGITDLTSGITSGEPKNWCPMSYVTDSPGFDLRVGAAMTAETGTWITYDGGATWIEAITTGTGVGTVEASCAVYRNKLFQATFSGAVRWLDLTAETPGAGTVLSAASGTAPTNCALVQTWGDRLVLSGDEEAPHVIYFSRVGNELDWEFADVDAGGAFATTTGSVGGILGEAVTSLIPHNLSCLLVGCTDSMYVMRGNPKSGGTFEILSHSVGPLTQAAWCKDGEDYTWILTRDGLYRMRPGCGEPPTKVSRQIIPDDLVAIDPTAGDRVGIAYDNRFNGIVIVVDYNAGTQSSYFYDLANGGFWPMSFSPVMRMALSIPDSSGTNVSSVKLIDDDCGVHEFDKSSSENVESYLYYGPIPVGTPHNEGLITDIDFVLGEDSGAVMYSIYGGDSAQQAYNGSASFTGGNLTIQGASYRQHPRVRCTAAYVKVEDVSNSDWSIEEIPLTVSVSARRRV